MREEILYDIANFENRNLTINVPSTWPNGTLEVITRIALKNILLLFFQNLPKFKLRRRIKKVVFFREHFE